MVLNGAIVCIDVIGGLQMAVLTVRNIEVDVKRRLRVAAAERGLSMEEHVRQVLRASIAEVGTSQHWLDRLRSDLAEIGFVDLELPARTGQLRPVAHVFPA